MLTQTQMTSLSAISLLVTNTPVLGTVSSSVCFASGLISKMCMSYQAPLAAVRKLRWILGRAGHMY